MSTFPNINSNAIYVDDDSSSMNSTDLVTFHLEQITLNTNHKLPCRMTPSTSLCSTSSHSSLSTVCSTQSQPNRLSGWGNYASKKSYISGLNSLAEGGHSAVEKISGPKISSQCPPTANATCSSWGFYDEMISS